VSRGPGPPVSSAGRSAGLRGKREGERNVLGIPALIAEEMRVSDHQFTSMGPHPVYAWPLFSHRARRRTRSGDGWRKVRVMDLLGLKDAVATTGGQPRRKSRHSRRGHNPLVSLQGSPARRLGGRSSWPWRLEERKDDVPLRRGDGSDAASCCLKRFQGTSPFHSESRVATAGGDRGASPRHRGSRVPPPQGNTGFSNPDGSHPE
jgi:hypothetical protein